MNSIVAETIRVAIVPSNFKEVFPFWRDELWPNRVSPIEEVSYMKFLGDLHNPHEVGQPYFWKGLDAYGKVAGVISGHPILNHQFRLRGIWVRPEYRVQGVGSALISQVLSTAASDLSAPKGEQKFVWAIPRMTSLNLFSKCGFTQESGPITEGVEFGPNYFARYKIP